MKFLINKKDIFESIKISNSIVDNSVTTPYIQGMYIEAKNNKIIIITSNGFISCKSEITENVKVIEEGNILVKSKVFTNIVSKLKNEEIHFEKVDNSVLKIKTQSFDSNINIMEAQEYPSINFNYTEWQEINIKPIVFKSILTKIMHSVSIEKEKMTILNGVCLESKNNKLSIVGTDSKRLSYLSYDYQGPEFKIVIDTSVFSLISDIIDFNDDIKLYISNNNIMIKIRNFVFSTKMMDGEYPNVDAPIRSPRDNFVLVNKKEIVDALERGLVLAMAEKKPRVKLTFKEDNITVSFKSIELGNSEELVKTIDFGGNQLSLCFNASFVISLLKVIDNNNIRIYSSKENKPLVITDDNEPNFIQLLFPLRDGY